ncbi:MAG: ATP-binding protein [Firmicutes bacterium]|nr:ATP-binding protein [Bacillota bacterium]
MSVSDTRIIQLLREYDAARSAAESAARDRKQLIYTRIPRIMEIDQELDSFGLRAVQTYLRSKKNKELVLRSLKESNHKLLAEKKQLLLEAGYAADYLDVHYRCPICQDTGYVDGQKCRCLQQKLIEQAYDKSNIKSLLQRENFTTFNLNRFSNEPVPGELLTPLENIKLVRDRVFNYINDFPKSQPGNLLFYGTTGTGKTFFCNCIAKALLDRGYTVLYMTAYELCSAFEAYRFRDKGRPASEEGSIQDLIQYIDLLIIDDLGTEFSTALSVSDLFYCINQRILLQKATIISTNLGLSQISKVYSDRTFSRISGNYQLLKLFGPDLRLQF